MHTASAAAVVLMDGDFPVLQVLADQPRDDVNQAMHVTGRHGFSFFVPARLLDGGRHSLSVASQGLGLFVAVEADCPGRFSDNAFTLFPGYPATLTFTPADPAAEPRFTLRDLASATAA